jgi:hypothetical protein
MTKEEIEAFEQQSAFLDRVDQGFGAGRAGRH